MQVQLNALLASRKVSPAAVTHQGFNATCVSVHGMSREHGRVWHELRPVSSAATEWKQHYIHFWPLLYST
jgi:hypothetical protein